MRRKRMARKRQAQLGSTESLESRALLTTFTVTSLADTVADDGETTLREAIIAAADATDEHSHDIVFADGLNGTISLELGAFDLSGFEFDVRLTITGNGRNNTIIDAHGDSDLFGISAGGLSLRSMTLQNSAGHGIRFGAPYSTGRLEDISITGSAGHGVQAYCDCYSGYSSGLNITNSTITGSGGRGLNIVGGMFMTVEDSEISGNVGGVHLNESYYHATPDVTFRNTAIRDNVTTENGGGILQRVAFLEIEDSVISGNQGADGGGIHVNSPVTISRSTIANNTATGDGGGAYFRYARGEVANVTVSGNTATQGGGLFFNEALRFNESPLVNSTITGNTATDQGGGAVFGPNLPSTFASNIVAGNTAANGSADLQAELTGESVFANNFIGSNDGTNLAETGTTPDGDGNFVGSTQALLDPQLGSQTVFGLQTVFRPQADSLVLSRGIDPLDTETDQVGLPRSLSGGVDIGAVEFAPSAIVIADTSVVEGDSGTQQLVFEVELSQPTAPFTVDVVAVGGTATLGEDFQSHSETLSFAGSVGETKQVTILVNGDADFEVSEIVLLRFQNISDSSIDLPDDAPGLIINDDTSDNIRLEGSELVVVGTPAADTVSVTLNGEFIDVVVNDEAGSFALSDVRRLAVTTDEGNDSITISGLTLESTVLAGAGDDTVLGGPGKDRIFGGPGNDILSGGETRDIIHGDDGDDSVLGDEGDDVLRGGDGDDSVFGGIGNDLIHGDTGSDVIEGGEGNDRVRGGGGNDTIRGAAGIDTLSGGGGGDLVNGGSDRDIVVGGNGADRLNGGDGDDHMNGGQGQDTIVGGDGSDTLLGREGNDVLLGDQGDDSLVGLTGRDIVYGGQGEDTLQGRASEDILVAGTITPPNGSTVRDLLIGGIRDEWLSGRSYDTRVANITNRDGQTSNRLNTDFLIGSRDGQNVFDDDVRDELASGGSLDLFFARAGSDLFDRANAEFLEEL